METGVTNMVSDFTNGTPGICITRTIYLVVASPLSDPIFGKPVRVHKQKTHCFLKMNDSSVLQLRSYSVISTKVWRLAKDIIGVTSFKSEPIISTRCLEVSKGHYAFSQAYQVNPYTR